MFIEDFNANKAEKEGYYLEINHLADITQEELKMRKGYTSMSNSNKACATPTFPDTLDWRSATANPKKINAVSNVKD